MTDQLYTNIQQMAIAEDGSLQPLTWDGEPLYSQETVKERLFETGAFEQQPGQLAMPEEESC